MPTTNHSYLWGKARPTIDGGPLYQPLTFHCLDVAACADVILMREPEATRARMAAVLSLEWEDARAWLLLVVACHDLGKACPGFHAKWSALLNLTGLWQPINPELKTLNMPVQRGDRLFNYWGNADPAYPLAYHYLDVAACLVWEQR